MTGAEPAILWHVAQMNWGILRADWDDPAVADFVGALGRVNAIAQRAPGFVWQLDEAAMEAEQLSPSGIFGGHPRVASTLSVWETAADLDHFVHRTVHASFMARAGAWFEPESTPRNVIWPVPAGHRPSMAEAKVRLDRLIAEGPSPEAYDFGYLRSRDTRTEAA